MSGCILSKKVIMRYSVYGIKPENGRGRGNGRKNRTAPARKPAEALKQKKTVLLEEL
jgi:hypothetical protein